MLKSLKLIAFGLLFIVFGIASIINIDTYTQNFDTVQVLLLPATATASTTASLNLRTGAGIGYKRLLTIPKGKSVTMHSSTSNGWRKVTYGGRTGYASGKYLTTSGSTKTIPSTNTKKDAPNKMYVAGKILTYKNGGKSKGQSIIDGNISTISTWGGAQVWSGTDGLNTHFIGHDNGAFKGIWNVQIGDLITVTDSKGNPTRYKTTEKFVVDDYGKHTVTGKNMYSYITSTEGGEVITLQTCETKDTNWIIRAQKIK